MLKDKYIVTKADGSPIEGPCFVLLAKDIFALYALKAYAAVTRQHHPSHAFGLETEEWADFFRSWRYKNPEKVKIPD